MKIPITYCGPYSEVTIAIAGAPVKAEKGVAVEVEKEIADELLSRKRGHWKNSSGSKKTKTKNEG